MVALKSVNQQSVNHNRPRIIGSCTDISIYVACLASYNAGYLHGIWIDLEEHDDINLVNEQINYMLSCSPVPDAEEYAIHDYCLPCSIGEYESLDKVLTIAHGVSEYGEAFGIYLDYNGVGSYGDCLEVFEEAYVGEYESELDFTCELVESIGMLDDVPEHIAKYFDYEAYCNDLFVGEYWSVNANSVTYVFRNI